jgi:hypothetical protein
VSLPSRGTGCAAANNHVTSTTAGRGRYIRTVWFQPGGASRLFTASDRQVPRTDPQRGGRVLEDASILAELEPHDAPFEVGDPIAGMSHREDRGVVLEA